MKLELDTRERQLLIDALIHPGYKKKISQPQIPFFIRELYKSLKEKLVNQEVEAHLKPEYTITILKKQLSFLKFRLPIMKKKQKEEATKAIMELDRSIGYLEDL